MDERLPSLWQRIRQPRAVAAAGAVLIGAVVLTVGVVTFVSDVEPLDARGLRFSTVTMTELDQRVRGHGRLRAQAERVIAARHPGTVIDVPVRAGERVEAGAIVVELGNDELTRKVAEAELGLVQRQLDHSRQRYELGKRHLELKAGLQRAQARLAEQVVELTAFESLVESGAVSRLQYEKAKAAKVSAQQEVETARMLLEGFEANRSEHLAQTDAALNKERAVVDLLKQEVEGLVVRAPVSGVVQALNESLRPGAPVTQGMELARVGLDEALIAELQIPATMAPTDPTSASVTLQVAGETVQGRILSIDPRVVNQTVRVMVAPTSPLPSSARPDLSISGELKAPGAEPMLVLERPAYAVATEAGAFVYRLDRNSGQLQRVAIRMRSESDERIAVEAGLAAGDEVLVSAVDIPPGAQSISLRNLN